MKVVADESVDFGIITGLREIGFQILSILEDHSGIKDEDVLRIAVKEKGLLITEDKDFGEIIYRLKQRHMGILLIRLTDMPRRERIELVVEIIVRHINDLRNNFSVLDRRGLRIKTGYQSS